MHTPKSVWLIIDKIHNKDIIILKKKKKFRKGHLRFSELSLNCTYSLLLYSFFYFMR